MHYSLRVRNNNIKTGEFSLNESCKNYVRKYKNKIDCELIRYLKPGIKYTTNKKGQIEISSGFFNHLKSQYQLNGRFKSSNNLLNDFQLVIENYINQYNVCTIRDGSLEFRLKNSTIKKYKNRNLKEFKLKTPIYLVFKFVKINKVLQI